MSTNQGPEYFASEKSYLNAQTIEDKIFWLKEMIRNFKKHKGSENMLAELKQRLKRLNIKKEKSKKIGKSTFKTIKKEGFQIVLVGPPNTGKSSLIEKITNAKPKISPTPFTTISPNIGTMFYQGVRAQIIDLPSVGSDLFDIGIINTADLILIVLERLEDIDKISPLLNKAYGKKIILINKADLLSEEELRKLREKINSKKINAVSISCLDSNNIEELKEKIFKNMNVIRIYFKEPGKPHSNIPAVLPINSTVKKAAESIRNGLSAQVKESRITGPSSKFPNQKVGLDHILKDLDIIEFHTK